MSDRWARFAPLTGVAFAVLTVVGILASGGETPEGSASPAKVIAYYAAHRSEIETSAILLALAFLFVVLFAASLRSYLRRTPAAEGLSALVLAGGVLMAAGALSTSGVEYGLAHNIHVLALSPQTAQATNLVSQELFLPILAGAFIFAVAGGLAILRGAQLPRWLGFAAIVLGIAALIPPASFPALIGFVIWSVVVSILIYVRIGRLGSGQPEPSPLGTA